MGNEKQYAELAAILAGAEHMVFLGGAGVSTGSGIPDFRGSDGLYTASSPEEEPPEPPPAEPPSGVKLHVPRNTTVVPSKVPLSQPENVHVPVRSPFCALEVEPAVKVVSTASIACSTLR